MLSLRKAGGRTQNKFFHLIPLMVTMKPITHILLAGFLLFTAQVFAQTPLVTSFSATPTNPALNSTVVVDFKVTNFTNIASVTIPRISYNATILRLDSVRQVLLPAFCPELTMACIEPTYAPSDPRYGQQNLQNLPAQNRLAVSWFPSPALYPNGVTLSGTKTVFKMYFTAIANGVVTVNIAPPQNGQGIFEVVNKDGQPVTVDYQNGGVSITSGDGTPPPPTYTGFKQIANTIYIPKGEVGCMPVTVNDFDNIVAMQYCASWNNQVLNFDCARAFDLPGMNGGHLFANNNLGRMSITWEGATPTQSNPNPTITRADGAKIYELCFLAKGADGATSNIQFNNSCSQPTAPPEVIQRQGSTNVDIWTSNVSVDAPINIVTSPAPADAVNFAAEKDSVNVGQTACVDVKVNNFTNMAYSEFALTYNHEKLQFQSFDLGANPLGLTTNTTLKHNIVEPNPGDTLRFISCVFNNTTMGVTLPANTTIFSACFKTIGAVGDTAMIRVKSLTIPNVACVPVGAAKRSVGSVPLTLTAGHVYMRSSATATTSVTTEVSCNNGNNGVVSANMLNCSGTLSYNWAGPGITASNRTMSAPNNLTPGTYTVTVSCSNGASATATVTLANPVAVSIANPTVVNPTCPLGSNGTITIAPTGGTAPYTYNWSGPSINAGNRTVQSPTGLTAGTYKVTVTDNRSCTFVSQNITITAPSEITMPAPTIVNVTCAALTNGSITLGTVSGGNGAPFTYSWSGPGSFSQLTKDITNVVAGNYTVVVTDNKNCSKTFGPYTVTEPAPLTTSATVTSQVVCFGTNTGKINLTVGGGTTPYTYAWFNVGANPITQVSTVEDPDNLPAGMYNVTVTDAKGCTTTLNGPRTITAPSAALTATVGTINPASCGGTPTGSVALNVSGGWTPTSTTWTWVQNPTTPIPAGNMITGLQSGTYVATVTDDKGCTVTATAQVPGPNPLSQGTPQVTQINCFGAGNGGITITPSGGSGAPYTVTWIGTTLGGPSISGLAPGTYTPIITDPTGCSQTFSPITITQPTEIKTLNIDVDTVTIAGNDGRIQLNLTGGSPNYSWTLKNAAGTTVASGSAIAANNYEVVVNGLAAGLYTLEVKDANNCGMTPANIDVPSENPLLCSSILNVENECNDDGSITISVCQQAVALPFVISGAGLTPIVSTAYTIDVPNLSAGTYTLTIADGAGHSFVLPTQVVTQNAPALVAPQINQPNQLQGNGQIVLTPNPTTTPMSYLWEDGSSLPFRFNLDQGTYAVTVTNLISGCTSTATYELVRQWPALVATIANSVSPTCAGTPTGAITLNVSGGNPNPAYTYLWTGPGINTTNQSSKNQSSLPAGTYTVIITDGNGTTSTLSATLTTQSNLAVTNVNILSNYNGFQVSSPSECDGSALVVFSGQQGATTIAWSNGATNTQTNTLCAGAYSVTVTDNLGCTSTWTGSLTAPAGVTATSLLVTDYNGYGVSCPGAEDGIARLSVVGGVPPYQIKWPTGQSDVLVNASDFSQAVDLEGGDYVVTITDDNGAQYTTTVTVTQPDPLTVAFAGVDPSTGNSCDAEIIAQVSGGVSPYEYLWDGNFGHTGQTQRAERLCSGEVINFVITDANGCELVVSDTIDFPESECFKVRPVITPHQLDGKNDFMFIPCIEEVSNTVEVYNRWGQLVFEGQNYDNGGTRWEGQTKSGQTLPEGVYYVVVRYTDATGDHLQKAHVNLLK